MCLCITLINLRTSVCSSLINMHTHNLMQISVFVQISVESYKSDKNPIFPQKEPFFNAATKTTILKSAKLINHQVNHIVWVYAKFLVFSLDLLDSIVCFSKSGFPGIQISDFGPIEGLFQLVAMLTGNENVKILPFESLDLKKNWTLFIKGLRQIAKEQIFDPMLIEGVHGMKINFLICILFLSKKLNFFVRSKVSSIMKFFVLR